MKFRVAPTGFSIQFRVRADNTTTGTGGALTNRSGSNNIVTFATTTFYLLADIYNHSPSSVGNDTIYKKIALHEIGHTMGIDHWYLDDQDPCALPGLVSVENGGCNVNDSSNKCPTSVTTCDNNKINQIANYALGDCYRCDGSTCVLDNLNGGYVSCSAAGCPSGGGGGGGGCELFDFDGDGWDSCEDCDDAYFDPSNECGECPCIRDTDCDLCNEGYCEISLQECFAYTPILIDVDGNGYRMTDAAGGVEFDFRGNGTRDSLSWTAVDSDDAWLALDRNGNGVIDKGAELFGSATPQAHTGGSPNGFIALAHYDRPLNGGNGDGVIDQGDAIFASLRLWQDTNHNGISEPGELHTLPELAVYVINLNYKESRRTDQYGNRFRYRGKVLDAYGASVGRWAWDVFLVKQ